MYNIQHIWVIIFATLQYSKYFPENALDRHAHTAQTHAHIYFSNVDQFENTEKEDYSNNIKTLY